MSSCCRRNPYAGAEDMDPGEAYRLGLITADRYRELTGAYAPGTLAEKTGGITKKPWFWPGVAVAAIGGLAVFADKKGK